MDGIVKINANAQQLIDKATGILLACYIVSTTVFEGNADLSKISSINLFAFLIVSCMRVSMIGRIMINYYMIAGWIYGIVLIVCYMFNSTDIAVQTLYWYFSCMVITAFAINYMNNEEKIRFVLKAYVLAGLVLCIVAYGYYGTEIFRQAASSEYGIRIGGEFGDENALGISCSYSIIFALYFMLFHHNTLIEKIFYSLTMILSLPFALLTGSKKALILIFVGMFLLFFLKKGGKFVFTRLGYMVLGIVAIYLVYQLLQKVDAFWYIGRRMDEMFQTLLGNSLSATDQGRLYMIERGLSAFQDHPILGNGVAYSNVMFGVYSHNNFVEILMNTGILGFVAYYSSFAVSFKRLFSRDRKGLWAIMLTVIASMLFLELGMVNYYTRNFQILLAAVSAYLCLKPKVLISKDTSNYSKISN